MSKTMIYRLFDPSVWQAFQKDGVFTGTQVDIDDGFIHFSSADQVYETAMKHYKGYKDLVLAGVPAQSCEADLKWEVSRGGDKFPHLFRSLHYSEVSGHWDLPYDGQGGYIWPDFIPVKD